MSSNPSFELEALEARLLLNADLPLPGSGSHGVGLGQGTALVQVEEVHFFSDPTALTGSGAGTDATAFDAFSGLAVEALPVPTQAGAAAGSQTAAVSVPVVQGDPPTADVAGLLPALKRLGVAAGGGAGGSSASAQVSVLNIANAPPSGSDPAVYSLDDDADVAAQLAMAGIEQGAGFTPVRPLLLVPGIGGTGTISGPDANAAFREWLTTRGIGPEKLQIDPLLHVYDKLIQSAQNLGYALNSTFWVVNYDWRVVPGPEPVNGGNGVIDGRIDGLSAAGITDTTYAYGVDYLGHYLKLACESWARSHNGQYPQDVDVIAHSTGGLVTRVYIQSDAYGQVMPGGAYNLPKVHDFVMMGVPNRGVSKAWNALLDDWSLDNSSKVVLSKILYAAYQILATPGGKITGPDGDIVLGPNGLSHEDFIQKYCPTIRGLLATYPFLDDAIPGGIGWNYRTVNTDPAQRNLLLLDLNDGLDLFYTPQQLNGARTLTVDGRVREPLGFVGAVTGRVVDLYSDSDTSTPIYARLRAGGLTDLNWAAPFDAYTGRPSNHSRTYEDISTGAGDGTVPAISSRDLFALSVPAYSNLVVNAIVLNSASVSQEADAVDHTGLMAAVAGQSAAFLPLMLGKFDPTLLATNRTGSTGSAGALLNAYLLGLYDSSTIKAAPIDPDTRAGLIDGAQKVDGAGSRLGDSSANSATAPRLALAGLDAGTAASALDDLNTVIPILNLPVKSLVGLDEIISTFSKVLASKLREPVPLTTDQVLSWLEAQANLPALTQGLSLELDRARSFGGQHLASLLGLATEAGHTDGELAFLFHIIVTGSREVPVSLSGATPSGVGVGLGAGATVRVQVRVEFNLVLGVEKRPGLSLSQRTFFMISDFSATAAAALTDFEAGVRLGFLGATIDNGNLSLETRLRLDFHDPNRDGRITMDELAATPLLGSTSAQPGLVTFAFSGSFHAALPVTPTLKGLPVPGVAPVLQVDAPDLFGDAPVSLSITGDTSLIDDFKDLTTDSFLDAMSKLAPYVQGLMADSIRSIPVIGPELVKVTSFASKIPDLLIKLRAAKDDETIDAFNESLQDALSELDLPREISLKLAADGTLQLAFTLEQSFDLDRTFTLQRTIAGVAALTVDADLHLEGSMTVSLVIGFSHSTDHSFFLVPAASVTGDGTKAALTIKAANTSPLTLDAHLGFLTFGIENGHFALGAPKTPAPVLPADADLIPAAFSIVDPARPAALGLLARDPNQDGRITLDELTRQTGEVFGVPTVVAALEIVLPFKPIDPVPPDPTSPSGLAEPPALVGFFLLNPLAPGTDWGIHTQKMEAYLTAQAENSIDGVVDLLHDLADRLDQWSRLGILDVKVPFLDINLHTVFDKFTGYLKVFFHDITRGDDVNAALDDVINRALDAALAETGLSQGELSLSSLKDSRWAPASGKVHFLLHLGHEEQRSYKFSLGSQVLALDATFTASLSLGADLEFGFSPEVGLYVVDRGTADPEGEAHATLTLAATGFGAEGAFGPIQFGVAGGSLIGRFTIGLDLKSGRQDHLILLGGLGDSETLNGVFGGRVALFLPLGLRFGKDGPGVTTTFSAGWDASQPDQIFFQGGRISLDGALPSTRSTDPADGFGAINFETGEFIGRLIKPFLEQLSGVNPLNAKIIDIIARLYEPLPILDRSPIEYLDLVSKALPLPAGVREAIGLLDQPAIKLLVQLDQVISRVQSLGGLDVGVDLRPFLKSEAGSVPQKIGNPTPTGGDSSTLSGLSGFLADIRDKYWVDLPILDPARVGSTIIGILLQKDVPLIAFKPPKPLTLTAQFDFPPIPIFGYGVPEVAEVAINLIFGGGITFFANPEFGISSRGFQKPGGVTLGSILDGFYVGDNLSPDGTDAFEVGVDFNAYAGISGSATVLGYDLAEVYGEFGLRARIGVDLADLRAVKDGSTAGFVDVDGVRKIRVGRTDKSKGDGRLNFDELQFLLSNYPGPLCIVTPGGSLHPVLTVGVRAGQIPFTDNYLFNVSAEKEFPAIFDYDFPCMPGPPPNVADYDPATGVLTVLADPSADDADVTVAVTRGVGGVVDGIRVTRKYSNVRIESETFSLTDRAAGVVDGKGRKIGGYIGLNPDGTPSITSLVVNGTNGKNTISVEPAVTYDARLPLRQILINGMDGDDSIFLGKLDPSKSSLRLPTAAPVATVISGGAGNDKIEGTPFADFIDGGAGDDTIDGYAGADQLHGGSGADLVTGGTGNDRLFGEAEDDTLYGGDGDDILDGGDGNDWVFGNGGRDILVDPSGLNVLFGDSGQVDGTHSLPGRASTTDPGIGAGDSITSGSGENVIFGGIEGDVIQCGDSFNVIFGDEGSVTFDAQGHVRSATTVLNVLGGVDHVTDGSGQDIIFGGEGDDVISGGAGDDLVFGDGGVVALASMHLVSAECAGSQNGVDTLLGGDGNDVLIGGNGPDHLEGGAGNDVLVGDWAQLSFNAGVLATILTSDAGAPGADVLMAGVGADLLIGGPLDDRLEAGTDTAMKVLVGDSASVSYTAGAWTRVRTVVGGLEGSDTLIGAAGRDILLGCGGIDSLTGGLGDDVVLGDHGMVTLDSAGFALQVVTEQGTIGGDDTLIGGAGDDALVGGPGSDGIDAGEGNDLVVGDLVSFTLDLRRAVTQPQALTLTGSPKGTGGQVVPAARDVVHGGAGDDVIYGGDDDDELFGDDGQDVIQGNDGLDRIWGGAGNDQLSGGEGNDVLRGESGDDQLSGGAGDDLLLGGDGKDVLMGQGGVDRLEGGAGDDTLYGFAADPSGDDNSQDLLLGQEGNDRLFGNGGDDRLDGGAGADLLEGGAGNDVLLGGTGVGDVLRGGDGNDVIYGSDEGADVLVIADGVPTTGDLIEGGGGEDIIYGMGGADWIDGGAGNDRIDSGPGGDRVLGGDGDDWIFAGQGFGDNVSGGAGSDVIYGSEEGNDTIAGGPGDDRLYGQGGDDVLDGQEGDDYLNGGAGADTIHGGVGNDEIEGGVGGVDHLYGDEGDDVIRGSEDGADVEDGGDGDDILFGNGGNDTLFGGAGNDQLHGGPGDDQLSGGSGADVLLGDGGHDVLYGGTVSERGASGELDFLYGDFGTNGNEPGSGNDRLYGGAANGSYYGEGGDDLIDVGTAPAAIVDFGAGEGPNPSAYVVPAPTPLPVPLGSPGQMVLTGASLPSGVVDPGRWGELAGSASGNGLSEGATLAFEPSTTSSADGTLYTAWVDTRRGNDEIYLARFTELTGWTQLGGSASENGVSRTLGSSRLPSVITDAAGRPIVAWIENRGLTTDVVASVWDGSAASGAGAWVPLGPPPNQGGISSSGRVVAQHLVRTQAGVAVVWLEAGPSGGTLIARVWNGVQWVPVGDGSDSGVLMSTAVGVREFSVAGDPGSGLMALSWANNSEVAAPSVRVFNGTTWRDAGGGGFDAARSGPDSTTLAFHDRRLYLAWSSEAADATIRIQTSWSDPSAAKLSWQVSGLAPLPALGATSLAGAAEHPRLASGGGSLWLVWAEDRLQNRTGTEVRLYARRWSGSSFMETVTGDASNQGVALGAVVPSIPVISVDATGHVQVAWSEALASGAGIRLLSHRLTAPARVFVADAATQTTVQNILDANVLQAGDLIVVQGIQSGGFTLSASDPGVVIVGAPGARIDGAVTLDHASGVVLQRLEFLSAVALSGSTGVTIRESVFQSGLGLSGGSTLRVAGSTLHGSVALRVQGGINGVRVEFNRLDGSDTGLLIGAGGVVDAEIRRNVVRGGVRGLALGADSAGHIAGNDLSGPGGTGGSIGLDLSAPFDGWIEANDIHDSGTGVVYAGAFRLSANRIHGNGTGVDARVADLAAALGYFGQTEPNEIDHNVTGVRLQGAMQNQRIHDNQVGVSGSGWLGSQADFDHPNVIEHNLTGVRISGRVQFNRIGWNGVGVEATSGLEVIHNVLYRNTTSALHVSGVEGVRLYQNTVYAPDGDAIRIEAGAGGVEVLNNILWTGAGYDLYVGNDSRSGFFSDYNDLHATGAGRLVFWALDFKDVLDWQADVARFDLHSIGTTPVNPGLSRPLFQSLARNDYRVMDSSAYLRQTSPTLDAGAAFLEPAVQVPAYRNLLQNPGFESGLSGWQTNPEAGVVGEEPAPFDGIKAFAAGEKELGFAQQTVDLLAAGYTTTALDSGSWLLTVGGRIRALNEEPPDSGALTLTFLDAGGRALGAVVRLDARSTTDRWELVGTTMRLPVGARSVTYRFECIRKPHNGSEAPDRQNNASLDDAFLALVPDTLAPDLGAHGFTRLEGAEPTGARLDLRSPDLYVDWERNRPHLIQWDSFGVDASARVRIDLLQDTVSGPVVVRTLGEAVPNTGNFSWIPADDGVAFGTTGLRIQVRLVGAPSRLDRSAEFFTVPQDTPVYYINDGSRVGDEFSLAAGSNRNTGKVPGAPKPGLNQVLRIYSVGAGQTVYVDTGTYLLHDPARISNTLGMGDDEGFTLLGASGVGHTPVLRFASPLDRLPFLDLDNADLVTVRHLTMDTGSMGLWLHHESTGFQGEALTVLNQTGSGIRVEEGSSVSLFLDVGVSNAVGGGAWVRGTIARWTGGRLEGNTGFGVELVGGGRSLLENLRILNNRGWGVSMEGPVTLQNSSLAGNDSNDPLQPAGGVSAQGLVHLIGNVISGSRVGILIESRDATATATNNRLYGNGVGLEADGTAELHGNVVYSNRTGIKLDADYTGQVTNNLVYANVVAGVLVLSADERVGPVIRNNTLDQASGDGVVLDGARWVTLRDNIFIQNGGAALVVPEDSQTGFVSNWNLFQTQGAGVVARWEGESRPTLFDWQNTGFQDLQSLQGDSRLVNPAGADGILGWVSAAQDGRDDDFHEQSVTGSFHGGSFAPVLDRASGLPVALTAELVHDAISSPALDRGDVDPAAALEPAFNGGFLNLGAYGGSPQASRSPDAFILVLAPDGSRPLQVGKNLVIRWRSAGVAGPLSIDLLGPAGTSVAASVASGLASPASGEFTWRVPTSLTPAAGYRLRIQSGGVAGLGAGPLTLLPAINVYYVNDATVQAGDWTTAAGSDRNTGLTAASPMASIRAVLETYSPGVGDVIKVDAGVYDLAASVVIRAVDAGVTIQGYSDSVNIGRHAVLSRGNATTGATVMEVRASSVTLADLVFEGGETGVLLPESAGADDVKILRSSFSGYSAYGLRVMGGNLRVLVDHADFRGAQGTLSGTETGARLDGESPTVRASRFHDNTGSGLDVEVRSGVVEDSEFDRNAMFGLRVEGVVPEPGSAESQGPATVVRVSGNRVHDNLAGLEASDQVLVSGNVITSHLKPGSVGLVLSGVARATDNLIQNNLTGVTLDGGGSELGGNRILQNEVGVRVAGSGRVDNNRIYSNQTGVRVSGVLQAQVDHNQIYLNRGVGFELVDVVSDAAGATVDSNTFFQNGTVALRLQGPHLPVLVTNNVFSIVTGTVMVIEPDAEAGFSSDYNLFDVGGGAALASWEGAVLSRRVDWLLELGFDRHSVEGDPKFADVDGLDNISGYRAVDAKDGGADDNFTPLPGSLAVDGADPSAPYAAEPGPNGARANLGHTGNTSSATASAAGIIQLLNPVGLEKVVVGSPVNIQWRFSGTVDPTFSVELSVDNGLTWSSLASGVKGSAGAGGYTWTAVGATVANTAKIRVRSGSVTGVSPTAFLIAPVGSVYYVNDATVASGDLTTAAGDNLNGGKDAAHPVRSLAALFNSYTFKPGDVLRVDAGTYSVLKNLVLDAALSGVRIEGVRATATGLPLSILNRNNTTRGSSVFELGSAENLTLSGLDLMGAEVGIRMQTGSGQASSRPVQFQMLGLVLERNLVSGASLEASPDLPTPWLVSEGRVHDNGSAGLELLGAIRMEGGEVYGQTGSRSVGLVLSDGVMVSHTLVHDNTVGIRASGAFTLAGARVMANTVTGLVVLDPDIHQHGFLVESNSFYGNGTGVAFTNRSEPGLFQHNILYGNLTTAILVSGGDLSGVGFTQNTLSEDRADLLRLQDGTRGVSLRNSILQSARGLVWNVAPDSENGLAADYNLYDLGSSALYARREGVDLATLEEGFMATGLDVHSGIGVPQFVASAGKDGLRGIDAATHRDGGADDNFQLKAGSPGVDAADPGAPFVNEPGLNGGRADVGAFGNSILAAVSPADVLQILSPAGLERAQVGRPLTVSWLVSGAARNAAVQIELSSDQGRTWSVVGSGTGGDALGHGSLVWVPGGALANQRVQLRVRAGALVGVAGPSFLVGGGGSDYYVNDAVVESGSLTSGSGSNANSGTDAAHPMASLVALVVLYRPGVGDRIHVDSGTYRLLTDVVLGPGQSGLIVTGGGRSIPVLDRGNAFPDHAAIVVAGGSSLSLVGLSLTGGRYGVIVPEATGVGDVPAMNLVVRDSVIWSNDNGGIRVGDGNHRVLIEGNRINGVLAGSETVNQNDGIWVESADAIIRGNMVFDSRASGIVATGPNAQVLANEVYGNRIGIYSDFLQLGDGIRIIGNRVHDNLETGIQASGQVEVAGNLVSGQKATGAVGIRLAYGARAADNQVFGNTTGLDATEESLVEHNRVFANSGDGILLEEKAAALRNQVYSNGTGIHGNNSFGGVIADNLVYASTEQALFTESDWDGATVRIVNNTLVQAVGDAVHIRPGAPHVVLRNNIIGISTGVALSVDPGGLGAVDSDFNLFQVALGGSAHLGVWEESTVDTLVAWRSASAQDAASLAGSAGFIDPDGADDVLGYRSSAGGLDGGMDDNFMLTRGSVAIDHADVESAPASDLRGAARMDDPGTPGVGPADLGAFEFRGSSQDFLPPRVVGGSLGDGSGAEVRLTGLVTEVILVMSEPLNPVDAGAPANYELREAGADGVFGDADDPVYVLVPGSDGVSRLILGIGEEGLPTGHYRLTVRGNRSLHDLSGNALDGDGDGQAGGDFVRTFRVDAEVPDVTGIVVNDGDEQRSVLTQVAFQFNQEVRVPSVASALKLQSAAGNVVSLSGAVLKYDPVGLSLTVVMSGLAAGTLPPGAYVLTLPAGAVTNSRGTPMSRNVSVTITLTAGDADGDQRVGDVDLYLVWQNLLLPVGQRDPAFDLNGDGVVDAADLAMVKGHYPVPPAAVSITAADVFRAAARLRPELGRIFPTVDGLRDRLSWLTL